jgi:hypothetical protein
MANLNVNLKNPNRIRKGRNVNQEASRNGTSRSGILLTVILGGYG